MLSFLKLIKQITVKQFEAFPGRNMFISEERDPLWSNILLAMPGGNKLKDLRAIISPAFTGSKLRTMFGLMKECAHFTNYFAEQEQSGFITVDIMNVFTKVSNDIIPTTAFGVTYNSLRNPENTVFEMGKDSSNFSRSFVVTISSKVVQLLKIHFIGEKASNFFRGIIKGAVNYPEENGLIRSGLIHLLMNAKKGRLRQGENAALESTIGKVEKFHTHDVMTAQAIDFFIACFETVARAMSFTAYELAINPGIQEKLHLEIKETLHMCNEEITYKALMGMKYLDMVVAETLRKWPPFVATDRKPIKNFTLQAKHPDEQHVYLNTDVICQIPIYPLHTSQILKSSTKKDLMI